MDKIRSKQNNLGIVTLYQNVYKTKNGSMTIPQQYYATKEDALAVARDRNGFIYDMTIAIKVEIVTISHA